MVEASEHDAKKHLTRLIDEDMAGEEVVILRSGRRLVRLVPVDQPLQRREPGTAKGEFRVPEDFDSPLSDDILAEFEG